MVWGMDIPSTFGDFWPRGRFEGDDDGWFDRLDKHFFEGPMPAEKKSLLENDLRAARLSYSLFVSMKLKGEPGARADGRGPPFIAVEQHEIPTFFKLEKSSETLGSLIALNYGILAVDENLKAILDRLEPDTHQFFPIEMRMPKAKTLPLQYYILLIGQYIESFSPADSKDGSWRKPLRGQFTHDSSKKSFGGLALSKAKFGNAHLWRERGFMDWLTCFSDELREEIERARLRLPKHYKMREV